MDGAPWSVHHDRGASLLRSGQWEEAAVAYRSAIRCRPDASASHVHLGHSLSHLGHWEQAAAAYRRALDLDPGIVEARVNLGNALLKTSAWKEAVVEYDACLRQRPDDAACHLNRGHALSHLGRWDAAASSYGRAVDLEPGVASSHVSLGDAYCRLKRWEDAAAAYQRALDVDPGADEARRKVAIALSKAGHRRASTEPGNLAEVTVDLEVTSACDAACGFCPRAAMPDKKRLISLDVVESLARDIEKNPVDLIVLCGIGESTLHPELERIVEILAATGTKVEMTTHGGRLDVERFERLVALGLCGVNFSLNANTAQTHREVMRLKGFDRTVANVESILEARDRHHPEITVHVSFVVCDLNQHEVADFVSFWRPKRPSRIWLHPLNNRAGLLSPAVKSVDMREHERRYEGDDLVLVDVFSEIHEEDRLCKVAESMIFISADGEMRLCAMDYQRVTSCGSAKSESLRDMHRSKLERYLRREMDDFCAGCDFCPPATKPAESQGVR